MGGIKGLCTACLFDPWRKDSNSRMTPALHSLGTSLTNSHLCVLAGRHALRPIIADRLCCFLFCFIVMAYITATSVAIYHKVRLTAS